MNIKVYVVDDRNESRLVTKMFNEESGYSTVTDLDDADIACFVGGADVSPSLYGQFIHKTTFVDERRDRREVNIYQQCLELGIPMVGICRGGQLLNVMNGGSMYQDVDGHNGKIHRCYIPGSTMPYYINSYHHQMMIPHDKTAKILLVANESNRRYRMSETHKLDGSPNEMKYEYASMSMRTSSTDIEAVYYENTNCLCYQAHPEYPGSEHVETRQLFFDFVDNYILGTIQRMVDDADQTAA